MRGLVTSQINPACRKSHFHNKTMWRGISHKCLFTYMAIIHPYTVTIISTSAFDNVIGVIRLSNLIIGVNYDLSERVNTVSKNSNHNVHFQEPGYMIQKLIQKSCYFGISLLPELSRLPGWNISVMSTHWQSHIMSVWSHAPTVIHCSPKFLHIQYRLCQIPNKVNNTKGISSHYT